ncbi:hypothetical protein [Streptomyces litchfieldiae]|uniref:Integral membrane protein n=1 Tax=Streptomyces litchfieldiae TaxID=3075543 RepID=A0ABU2MT23_9ACTN|nr:hypothetical protein [Streptomyces sp. DSM 44938]MDT0344680.1 hypothetical protein [Streptomyces sp. DSM 44938]
MRTARLALGAAGLALLAVGVRYLFTDTPAGAPREVAVWLAGVVLAHDLVLAPLVLLVGLAVRHVPARRAIRGGLLVAGCLTLIALPPLLRPGAPRNATALPLDYGRNLALLLATTALVTAAVAAVSASRRGRRRPVRSEEE